MSSKFCETCGSTLLDGAKFCNSCGALVSGDSPPQAVAQTTVPPQQRVTPVTAPPPVQTVPSPQQTYYQSPAQAPQKPIPPPQQAYYQAPPQSQVPPQQTYYQAPPQNYNRNTQNIAPMTVLQYLGTFLISAIPLVGTIMLFIWAFSSDTNINKKNYARAILILGGIVIIFYIIILIVFGVSMLTMFKSSGGGYYNY